MSAIESFAKYVSGLGRTLRASHQTTNEGIAVIIQHVQGKDVTAGGSSGMRSLITDQAEQYGLTQCFGWCETNTSPINFEAVFRE